MNVSQIVEKLQQEQVVAYPTEAVFGLGCNPMSESAVEKLLILKNRPKKRIDFDCTKFGLFIAFY